MVFISLINDHFYSSNNVLWCGLFVKRSTIISVIRKKKILIFLILESNLGLKRANTLHYIGMQTMSVLKKPDMAGKWTILRSWNSSKTKLEFKELNPGL